jgi:hypothetical protein
MSLKSVSRAFSRVLATTTLVALSLPALAQDESGPNLGPDAEGAAPGGASTMSLAQELYAIGLSQGDAVTVLAAAKMAASVDAVTAEPAALDPATMTFDEGETTLRRKAAPVAVPATPAPMGTDGTTRAVAKASFFNATSEEDGAVDAPVSADAMFARSKELAAGDDALLAVIESAMAEGPRDRIGGAVSWPSRLAAGTTDVWEVPFYANFRAEIAVIGDGDANLDVVVTDETGNVFCRDVSWSDSLYCDFTPARVGYFYVTVENLGRARNSYHLMTN